MMFVLTECTNVTDTQTDRHCMTAKAEAKINENKLKDKQISTISPIRQMREGSQRVSAGCNGVDLWQRCFQAGPKEL